MSAENVTLEDRVNHPNHYANKKIEVISYIEDTLTRTGYTDYCLGNVLKYVSRWRNKGGVEDLKKAHVYLGWAIESAEKEEMEAINKIGQMLEPVDQKWKDYYRDQAAAVSNAKNSQVIME